MENHTRLEVPAETHLDVPAGDGTRLEEPVSGQSSPWLPSSIAKRYNIVRPFPAAGAEADLYEVTDLVTNAHVVLKLYRMGLRPKLDVIRMLQQCDPKHVVKILETDEADGFWYEVLEYGEFGTLRDLFRSEAMESDFVRQVLIEMNEALKHIHSHHLIHRDLKPENVLVRSKQPLDLMLTDFGIASLSEQTKHFTSTNRTVKYGAPEAAGGVVAASSDYWSLGLILLEALLGKHPFEGLSDLVILNQLISYSIDLSEVREPRWGILLKGLLTRNSEKRWGGMQVDEWLEGKTPSVAFEDDERPSQRPYTISRKKCWTATELAVALASHWKTGVRDIGRGLIVPWLRDELRDQEACRILMDLMEDRKLTHDERLLRFIAHIGRGLPANWKGLSLDLSSIIRFCHDNLNDSPSHAGMIEELYEKEVFDVWGKAGNEEAGSIGEQWRAAVQEFDSEWNRLAAAKEIAQHSPSKKLLLPTLLLAIVSAEFRSALERDLAQCSESIGASDWYADLSEKHSLAILVLKHTIQNEAVSSGQKEQEAAVNVKIFIDSLQHDFESSLGSDLDYQQALKNIQEAVAKKQARKLEGQINAIRDNLFKKAKASLVSIEFRRQTVRGFGEILLDGAIVGSLFVLYRAFLAYWQLGEWVLGLGLLGLIGMAYLGTKQLMSVYFPKAFNGNQAPTDTKNG